MPKNIPCVLSTPKTLYWVVYKQLPGGRGELQEALLDGANLFFYFKTRVYLLLCVFSMFFIFGYVLYHLLLFYRCFTKTKQKKLVFKCVCFSSLTHFGCFQTVPEVYPTQTFTQNLIFLRKYRLL